MNKVISFAFLAIFVFYGFHRCSQLHPAKYFDKPANAQPASKAPSADTVEPPGAPNPFLEPAHAEVRKRLDTRNAAESKSTPVNASGDSERAKEAEGKSKANGDTGEDAEAEAWNQGGRSASGEASTKSRSETQSEGAGSGDTAHESKGFSCMGKTYCSQMKSCEEAKYYLANCPGVEIDGDGDGIPCEEQFCGR
jgi:hypothetical protein